MKSDQLEAVQTGVRILRTLAWALAALAIVLYAAAVYLAGARRRETFRAVGIAFIGVGVAVLFAHGLAGNYVVGALTTTAASEPAANATWSIGTSQLVEIAQGLVLYGLVIVLAAWLAGPSATATWIRRGITPYLRQPRFAFGGLAVLLALFFWWGPTEGTRRVVPSLVLIALTVLGVEILRRQVIREFPDHVTTGSAEGLAQRISERMRDARERRAAPGRAARRPARAARTAPRFRRPVGRRVRRREEPDPRGSVATLIEWRLGGSSAPARLTPWRRTRSGSSSRRIAIGSSVTSPCRARATAAASPST
jgi:hypothetical protein